MDTGSPGAAFTVATTVASLGAGTDGKAGIIRAGGTGGIADSWKEVIYDATYAKWISAEREMYHASLVMYLTGYSAVLDAPLQSEPWAIFNTAGLTPQARHTCALVTAVGTVTVYSRVGYASYNADDTFVGATGVGVDLVAGVVAVSHSITTGTRRWKASAWTQIPGGFTAKTFIRWGIQAYGDANGSYSDNNTVWSRWVG